MLPTQPNPDRRPHRHASAQARRALIQYHARLQAIRNSTAKLAHQSLYMAAHYALGPVDMPVPSTPCRSAHNIQRLHGQRKWVARNRPWLFVGVARYLIDVARYLIERCRTASHRLVLQSTSPSSDAPPRALHMSSWTKVPQVTGLRAPAPALDLEQARAQHDKVTVGQLPAGGLEPVVDVDERGVAGAQRGALGVLDLDAALAADDVAGGRAAAHALDAAGRPDDDQHAGGRARARARVHLAAPLQQLAQQLDLRARACGVCASGLPLLQTLLVHDLFTERAFTTMCIRKRCSDHRYPCSCIEQITDLHACRPDNCKLSRPPTQCTAQSEPAALKCHSRERIVLK